MAEVVVLTVAKPWWSFALREWAVVVVAQMAPGQTMQMVWLLAARTSARVSDSSRLKDGVGRR